MATPIFLFLKAQARGDSSTGDLFDSVVQVSGYTTKKGTYVAPHSGRRRKKAAQKKAPKKASKLDIGIEDLFGAVYDGLAVETGKHEKAKKQKGKQPHPDDSLLPEDVDHWAAEYIELSAEAAKLDQLPHEIDAVEHRYRDGQIAIDDAVEAMHDIVKRSKAFNQPRKAAFKPTHILSDGTKVVPHDDESGVWIDQNGDEIEDDFSKPIQPIQPQNAKKPSKPNKPKKANDGRSRKPVAAAVSVSDFGAPEGATKKERRQLNARAFDLLQNKTEFTPEEKAELALYSGQGGVGDSLNEYYTRPDVVEAMYSVLGVLGIHGGNVLEPSCGTGVFMAGAPQGFQATGVELDGTSAKIAQILHGDVNHNSLERFATSDPRQFDAVVGNAPFGVRGGTVKDDKPELPTAEQYFVDTSIDKLKTDGVMAMIVPTGIMDGKNTRGFRERILRKAELIGAHRLPNTAFAHSHTGVTSDILLFRRRSPDVAQALSTVPRETLEKLGIWDDEFVAGKYFTGRGAGNVYGTPEDGWRKKAGMGNDFTVSGDMHGVADAIEGWTPPAAGEPVSMAHVLDALGDDEVARRRATNAALKPPYETAQLGDTKLINGVTYVLQGEPPRWHRAEEEETQALADAREAADLVERLASGSAGGAEVVAMLDRYIETHGNPHDSRDVKAEAQQDPKLWRLLAAVDKHGIYSDMVTGKQRDKGDSFDAVAQRLALDNGGFTAEEVADYWTGGDREAALDHLFASPAFAVEADGATWSTVDDYLSGNLWEKLDSAQEAQKHEGLTEHYRDKYAEQIKELEKAIDRKPLEEVEVTINSGWIPLDVLEAWQADKIKAYQKENATSKWAQDMAPMTFRYEKGIYTVKGGFYESELLSKYLNRKGVRKDDRSTIDRLNEGFRDWLLTSEERERVEELYNRKFRGEKAKTYSKAPMEVPGLNPDIDINDYHWSNLRWAMDRGKGIIAADVGLGKTVEGLALARLLKASGQAKKPMIVVPKSVLANWAAEIELFFPGSSVMIVGESIGKGGKPRADTKADRDRKLHEIAQSNSYDFILISQSAFDDVDLDPITKGEYHEKDFWVQRGDQLGNAGDKRTKRIRESYEQAMAQRDVTARTDAIYFNDLGVDAIIGDEFHAYKNLYAARSRFGDTPRFLGGSGLSDRALDVNYKARWILNQNKGKGVFGMTATPTKNSPLEIYSMLSHVAPELWENLGIKNAEDFLDRYALFEEGTYLGTTGNISSGTITTGFKNMDELRELMGRYINHQTAADVGLKIPEKDNRRHMIEMSAEQQDIYAELRELADETDKDSTGDAHIFAIMSNMAKVAIDPELYDPVRFKGAKSPKLEQAADNILSGSKDGAQVVFADHNDVHEKLASLLEKRGMDRKRIGIINAKAAKSAAARQRIAEAFNRGDLDVVIGNTSVMGEGLNLQKNTTDLHHLDLPWEPASLQQRNGRAVRQKNKNESVRIHTYLAKGSFDGYRYQTMLAKRDWQDEIWNGGDKVENMAREGAVNRDELLIMLSADPDEARKAIAENKSIQEEQIAAAGRSKANERFVHFQEMTRGYKAMKNKGTAGAAKLHDRIKRERDHLKGNKWFLAKDALDMDKPVVVQPQTGEAWHAGKAFEMDAGQEAPIYYSATEKSKWVVTGVEKGIVKARSYGNLKGTQTSFDLDKMHRGISAVSGYSADTERKEVEAAKRSKDLADVMSIGLGRNIDAKELSSLKTHVETAITEGRKAHQWWSSMQNRAVMLTKIRNAMWQHAPNKKASKESLEKASKNMYLSVLFADAGIPAVLTAPGDLNAVDPAVTRMFGNELQDHLKEKLRTFKSRSTGPVGLIDSNGRYVAVPSYNSHRELDTHDLILPTEESKEKLYRSWAEAERTKEEVTRYTSGRRTKSYTEVAYQGFEYGSERGNPWTSIGGHLFGDGFVAEARKRLDARVAHDIKYLGGSFTEAKERASAARISQHNRLIWPAGLLHALWGRAKADGVLNEHAESLINAASRDRHADVARKMIVSGVSDGAHDVGFALDALDGLRTERSGSLPGARSTYSYPKDLLESMLHLVRENGVQNKEVKEVLGDRLIRYDSMLGGAKTFGKTIEEVIQERMNGVAA